MLVKGESNGERVVMLVVRLCVLSVVRMNYYRRNAQASGLRSRLIARALL